MKSDFFKLFSLSLAFNFSNLAIKPYLTIPLHSHISIGSYFVTKSNYFLKEIGISPINGIESFVGWKSLVV